MVVKYLIIAYLGALIANTNGLTGQALPNRPIVLGPFVGLVLGDVVQGTIIGAYLELAYMGVMVIGISTAVNMTVASLLGTTYALTNGAGAELAITLAVPCSMLYTLVSQAISPLLVLLSRIEIHAAEDGNTKKFELWHWIMWWRRTVIDGTVFFIALLLGSVVVEAFVANAPAALMRGLKAGTTLIPALGFAMLMNLCWSKEVGAFFFIGYVFSIYLGLDNIAISILAAAFAVIAFFFVKDGKETEIADDEPEESKAPRILDKKILNKVIWRSYQLEADFSTERFQGTGFGYSLVPALQVLYKDRPDDYKEALGRHVEFFNTTPTVVTLITGIALAMEEEKAVSGTVSGQAISSVKVALMGPAAGIGDAIFWGSYRIMCASIACQMGVNGSILAPFVFLILFNIPNVIIHHWGLLKTYELGSGAVKKLYQSGLMDKITLCCSIMGITMVGAMTGSLVSVTTALQFTIGETTFVVQELLDSIMPGLLSLITVFALSKVMKKQANVIVVMLVLMAIGIVGAFIGIF